MTKKIIFATLAAIIVLVGGFYYYKASKSSRGVVKPVAKSVLVVNPGGETFTFFLNTFSEELKKIYPAGEIEIVYKETQGDGEKLKSIIAEAQNDRPNVIVTISAPPTLAIKDKITDTPILTALGDPVEHGYIKSLQGSGINIAGVAQKTIELTPKRIEILKRLAPKIKNVAVFYDTTCGPTKKARPIANTQAPALGIKLTEFAVTNPTRDDLEKELQKVTAKDFDALMFYPHGTLFSKSDLFLKRAKEEKLPIVMPEELSIGDTAIASYGPDYTELARSLAVIARKILNGGNPATLPFEQPGSIYFVINEKNAKAIGFSVPEDMYDIASKIIR